MGLPVLSLVPQGTASGSEFPSAYSGVAVHFLSLESKNKSQDR